MVSIMKEKIAGSFAKLIQLLSNNPKVDLIEPTDPRYSTARLVYNRMHDCYPKLIVRTLDVDALRTIMKFAFTNEIVLAIRGGGHHIGGFGTCNDGIIIDFSVFKDIYLDRENNIAQVSPGATLGDVDRELCKEGFVLPTGTISETGVAGLTLGGGIGWLIGMYGLTCDQLCGADVLLADGRLVRAEDPEHGDLLWALRGGGGNFGIVTQFRYKLNPLPKTICGMGLVTWANTKEVLIKLFKYLNDQCSDAMTIAPVLVKDKKNEPCLRIDFCCANGTLDEVKELTSLSPYIRWSEVREWNFSAWQKEFDETLSVPKRGYWKASYTSSVTDEALIELCEAFANAPKGDCTIMIEHLHGAFANYDLDVSSFPLRHTRFGILFSARWDEPVDDQAYIAWVRQSFNKIDPKDNSMAYLNYTSADDHRAVETLLTHTKSRIVKVKSHYDPINYFKRNHNVRPGSASTGSS